MRTAQFSMEQRIRRLEEIEEIEQLKAAYCNNLDGGWSGKGPSHMGPIGDIFVENGIQDGRPDAPIARGRDEIIRMIEGYRIVPFILHYVLMNTFVYLGAFLNPLIFEPLVRLIGLRQFSSGWRRRCWAWLRSA